MLFVGAIYWLLWAKILPWIGKYELVEETAVDPIDGWERNYFTTRSLKST